MPSEDSALRQAMDTLTLAQVWELAPDGSEAPVRDGVRKSPFRSERNPSFSVTESLRFWKDFATGKKRQGVWAFVQACRPDWSKGQIATYLVDKAGLSGQTKWEPKSKTQWQKERAERNRNLKNKFATDRKKALTLPQADEHPEWPEAVCEWFYDAMPTDEQVEKLSERRGWPIDWTDMLVLDGLLRWPLLPWKRARFSALLVQVPAKGEESLRPIGYHQRIWSSDSKAPAWLFVPWSPKPGQQGGIMDACREAAKGRGLEPGQPMVTPAPFVLGDPWTANVWIIMEGQWDAVTCWGALHGFYECNDLPVAVFGIRGASSGCAAFLSAWGSLLRRRSPSVWMVPDNDAAGAEWDGLGIRSEGANPTVRFVDQVVAAVGRGDKVRVSRVPAARGKDLNDWWRNDPEGCRAALLKRVAAMLEGL